MTSISVRGLKKSYGGTVVVGSIDLQIDPGKLVVLLGPSGCGKTTTLRCIAGLEEVSDGEISIGGQVVSSATDSVPPERRSIGMVFQSYAVWPHMNVFENIAYGVKLQKLSKMQVKQRVDNALQIVGLTDYAGRSASELSGGQQQRVALARAIALQPKALLFDEPLSNLDAKLRQRMRFEIRMLQQKLGITSVYVTHDQEEAMVVADQIVLMRDGRIEQAGTPREIYDRPQTIFAAEFIGSANILPGTVENRSGAGLSVAIGGGLRLVGLAPSALPSGEVDVVIRPENVAIVDGSAGDRNLLRGTVVSSVFLGGLSETAIDIGGMAFRVSVAPARLFPAGTDLTLAIDPKDVVILPADRSARSVGSPRPTPALKETSNAQ